MKICVCLSIGRHPASHRQRMAAGDRIALELALSSGHEAFAVHAGPDSEILKEYLGMGLRELHRLDTGSGEPVSALETFIKQIGADLVLTGSMAEVGSSTGMVPYVLAERLNWPMLAGVVSFTEADGLQVTQAASGGRRRLRAGKLPAVLAVDPRAARHRISTLAAARAGKIVVHQAPGELAAEALPPSVPAKKRGVRLRPGKVAAHTPSVVRNDLSSQEAARTILEFLRAEGHVAPSQHDNPDRSSNV
jgi:electron transfer flavoprotein beta subunit